MHSPPDTHKLVAAHLRDQMGGNASVSVYRDNHGKRPTPIGSFGSTGRKLFSTIGVFERELPVPSGAYELAAVGTQAWLPNSLASSLYWLTGRRFESWPLVCEDVVKQNARSTYRHMAYVPSGNRFEVVPGVHIRWLLGVPLSDKDIALPLAAVYGRAAATYPAWLAPSGA